MLNIHIKDMQFTFTSLKVEAIKCLNVGNFYLFNIYSRYCSYDAIVIFSANVSISLTRSLMGCFANPTRLFIPTAI